MKPKVWHDIEVTDARSDEYVFDGGDVIKYERHENATWLFLDTGYRVRITDTVIQKLMEDAVMDKLQGKKS